MYELVETLHFIFFIHWKFTTFLYFSFQKNSLTQICVQKNLSATFSFRLRFENRTGRYFSRMDVDCVLSMLWFLPHPEEASLCRILNYICSQHSIKQFGDKWAKNTISVILKCMSIFTSFMSQTKIPLNSSLVLYY